MQPNFRKDLEGLSVYIQDEVTKVGVTYLRETTAEVKDQVEDLYNRFFEEMFEALKEGASGTPWSLASNMGGAGPWQPLSQRWVKEKRRNGGLDDFYRGLSGLPAKMPRSGKYRVFKQRVKRSSAPSFFSYISSLASSAGATSRFFGPVQLDYMLTSEGRSIPLNVRAGVIEQVGKLRDAKGRFAQMSSDLELRSTVTMFPQLAAVEFSEWYVADYLARVSGQPEEWRKVNARRTFGAHRPIRAIITPLISWYATDGMTRILERSFR